MSKQDTISTKSTSAALVPKHVFGFRTDITNCVQFFSPDKCAYIAGYYGVICMIKRNAQYFFPAFAEYREITSFCVDESHECIVFFMSQKVNDRIYFTFRYINKTYLTAEPGRTKNLYFQVDQKQVVLASTLNLQNGVFAALIGPDIPSMVVIYSLENKYSPKLVNKITLQASFPYKNLIINKFDTEKLTLWGNGGYAIIYLHTKDIKPLEINNTSFQEFAKCSFNVVSAVWLSKTCVAFLADNCDIMLINFVGRYKGDNLAHRKVIKWSSIFESPSKGIALFEKNNNLFVTRDDGFIVKLDSKCTKEEILYEKANSSFRAVTNLPFMEVEYLSSSKVTETSQTFGVLFATKNGQLYTLDLSNDNAICDGVNYKYLLCSFHSNEVTSIDVAKWKQLVVTCSIDRTVRVWNYVNLQLEAMANFEDIPLKVAFHPNGLHVAILFKSCVKLMDILENTLKEYREFRVYQPNDIKFSNFGTMLCVCFKNFFRLYNFYTGAKILETKDITIENTVMHTEELKNVTFDKDDDGISTCGDDGKVIYWNLRNLSQPIVYQKDNAYFRKTEIMTLEDQINKKIFALDSKNLMEIYHKKEKKDEDMKVENDKDSNELQVNIIEEGFFSDMLLDQELKLLILTTPEDETCGIKILDYGKYLSIGNKDLLSFPGNAFGIRAIKATNDMTHVFTVGNDRCLFFFNLVNVSKSADKREIEIHEPENLILIPKEYLDINAKNLREELNLKDLEIQREEEDFKADTEKYRKEISEQEDIYNATVGEFNLNQQELLDKKTKQIEYYESELEKERKEHQLKMEKLQEEQDENVNAKEEDKKNEQKIFKNEQIKNSKNLRILIDEIAKDKKLCEEEHKKIFEDLNNEIKKLEEEKSDILNKIENEKKDKMENNDKDIADQRRELDKLKKSYEDTKRKHKEKEDKLKKQIDDIKNYNKRLENNRTKQKSELETIQLENAKLEKQINDMKNDKLEKEETIKDKNELKRKLDKDNQELEKFKYVLHYKIKELKHAKEPKERKIQLMEKKAKDMEREIKSCELGQATIIIDLSTNHQIIKIHEEQIRKTEMRIEELRRYKKLFQENLYNSMKRAKNHKDCKRELVLLKRNFLDKEKIENVEKPFESNYELQREFLEKNVDHYKSKISKLNDLFKNDHSKVMKEKRQLIEIVNQLEKEKKEIEQNDDYKSDKNNVVIGKSKGKLKPDVPRFPHPKKKKEELEEAEVDERNLKELAEKLKSIEKKIQWYKYWGKKQDMEKFNKDKMERKNLQNEAKDDDLETYD